MSDLVSMSDEQLVKLYSENFTEALDILSARYMKISQSIASSLGICADEFSDYVQEGMIGFLSAVCCYEESRQARFSTYACACIKNRMLSVLRKSAAKSNIPAELTVSFEQQSPCVSGELTPEQYIISERNISDILCAIDNLSDREKSAFRLFLAGFSYDELAQKLSLTPKAVDGTLQRARKKLRKVLSS